MGTLQQDGSSQCYCERFQRTNSSNVSPSLMCPSTTILLRLGSSRSSLPMMRTGSMCVLRQFCAKCTFARGPVWEHLRSGMVARVEHTGVHARSLYHRQWCYHPQGDAGARETRDDGAQLRWWSCDYIQGPC